jgi:hypothetical protein
VERTVRRKIVGAITTLLQSPPNVDLLSAINARSKPEWMRKLQENNGSKIAQHRKDDADGTTGCCGNT